MLISPAFAQTAGEASGGLAGLMQLAPLVMIFVVFYFMLIRPQQKRMKEHKERLEAIRRGDRVVTGGGILGTVVKADEQELVVEIASGVKVTVLRSTIADIVAKTEPVKGDDKKEETAKDDEKKSLVGELKAALSENKDGSQK